MWVILGDASEARVSAERKAVLNAMEELPTPASPTEIAAAAELKPGNVRRMLARLAREGTVQRTERGRYAISLGQ
jgi:DNA-binding IclR family transcriptional regulator